jgi:hypothetical protein
LLSDTCVFRDEVGPHGHETRPRAVLATLGVLGAKFHRSAAWLAEAEQQLRVVARFLAPTEHLFVIEADPTDDRILAFSPCYRVARWQDRRSSRGPE